jgi:large subunit ribosomal protein L21
LTEGAAGRILRFRASDGTGVRPHVHVAAAACVAASNQIRGSMYAVIETGGKQYRVEVGTVLEVEKLDVEAGQTVTLDRVLLVADGDETAIGRPVVANASVSAEVVRQDRADKVIVFKYRPKARRRVKKGHRQDQTVLRIADITLDGKSAAAASKKADQDKKTERQRLEEAAAKQAAADAALAAKLAKPEPAAPAKGATKAKAAKDEKAEPAEAAPPKAAAKGATKAKTAKAEKADAVAETPEADAGATPKAAPKRRATKKDE